MKDFFVAYWKDILSIGAALIVVLISLIRKPGKNSPVLEEVYFQLPVIISKVEKIIGAGKGAEKKAMAIDLADKVFYLLSGIHLKDSAYYLKLVDNQIEKILSTPSRKEKDEK